MRGWKRLYLSRVGRITLIKSILSNLSTYFLSLFPLPDSVPNQIEKLRQDLLWKGMGDEVKFHLVRWHEGCFLLTEGFGGLKFAHVQLIPFSKVVMALHYAYKRGSLEKGNDH